MNAPLISSTLTTPLPENWVEKLFHRMLLAYGKKFTDQWGGADTDELIAFWSEGLAGYSGEELKRGLTAMEGRDWPPTLPEFKKLCRQPVNEMSAYYEAVNGVQARSAGEMGKWSHPAIYWAAMPLAFDLGSQTYSQIKERWSKALFDQMELGKWDPIPAAMKALPAPGKSELSKEKAKAMLDELGAVGIVKSVNDNVDHKRWAKLIMVRHERGDKSLLLLQVQFARTALGIEVEAA